MVHSVALPLQPDELGVVQEAVQDCPDSRGIAQHLTPVLQRTIGSQY